jgi:hypothetical protein
VPEQDAAQPLADPLPADFALELGLLDLVNKRCVDSMVTLLARVVLDR